MMGRLSDSLLDGWWIDAGTFPSLLRASKSVEKTRPNEEDQTRDEGRRATDETPGDGRGGLYRLGVRAPGPAGELGGPYQFPEKLNPLMISSAMEDRPLPIYGDGPQVRDWLYLDDHCRAIFAALTTGHSGEIYHVGGSTALPNIERYAAEQEWIAHVGSGDYLHYYERNYAGRSSEAPLFG